MKKEESEHKKQKFLELRVLQGKSFDSIVKELRISKQTAINWSVELKDEIQNLETAKYDGLIAELQISHFNRMKQLGNLYNRLRDELEKKDFSNVPTMKLFQMLTKLNDELYFEKNFISEIDEDPLDDFFDKRTKVKLST